MANPVYKLIRSGTYLNGRSLIGQIMGIELPEITWDTTEHEAIGLIGAAEYARRMPQLQSTLTTAGFSPQLADAAANPNASALINLREAYGMYVGSQLIRSVLKNTIMRGRFLSLNMGEITQTDEPEQESVLNVDYIKIEFDGNLIMEFARDANIYRTATFDYTAAQRAIIGE